MASSTASERRNASAGGKGGSHQSSGRRPARKKALSTRMGTWLLAHPIIAGVACAAFLAGAVVLIFWFSNFSGLSSSADFVYSKF